MQTSKMDLAFMSAALLFQFNVGEAFLQYGGLYPNRHPLKDG